MRLLQQIALLAAVPVLTAAASPNGYTVASTSKLIVPARGGFGKIVRVRFTDAIDGNFAGNLAASNLQLIAEPSGKNLQAGTATPTPSIDFGIDIPYMNDPEDGDTEIKVSLSSIQFGDMHTAVGLNGSASLANSVIAQQKQNALDTLKKVPKSTNEQNIFASGFVTTASSGTSGGADIILNSLDLGVPNLTSFLQIKKSSVSGGDPKNFEAGARYQNVWVHDAGKFTQIHDKLAEYHTTGNEALLKDVATLEQAIQKRTLAATIIDFAAKLEGQATQFNVSNAVGDGSLQLQTMTKKLGSSNHGYWRWRIIPAGFEGGRNLNSSGQGQTPVTALDGQKLSDISWIARFKAGTEFTMFYDNPKSVAPVKRIELTAGVVERYLFFNEARYDTATKAIMTTQTGSRPWSQVDLKFIVGETSSARYGFKLTYQRGSLPPVFADTKAFQLGFLYETIANPKN